MSCDHTYLFKKTLLNYTQIDVLLFQSAICMVSYNQIITSTLYRYIYKKLGDRRYHRASGNNEYDCNGDTTQAAQSRDYHQFLTNLATPVFVLATWETGIDLVLNWVQVSRFLTYLIRSKHVLKERVSRPNHENNPKKTRIKK